MREDGTDGEDWGQEEPSFPCHMLLALIAELKLLNPLHARGEHLPFTIMANFRHCLMFSVTPEGNIRQDFDHFHSRVFRSNFRSRNWHNMTAEVGLQSWEIRMNLSDRIVWDEKQYRANRSSKIGPGPVKSDARMSQKCCRMSQKCCRLLWSTTSPRFVVDAVLWMAGIYTQD